MNDNSAFPIRTTYTYNDGRLIAVEDAAGGREVEAGPTSPPPPSLGGNWDAASIGSESVQVVIQAVGPSLSSRWSGLVSISFQEFNSGVQEKSSTGTQLVCPAQLRCDPPRDRVGFLY
jgi:hypothetical protein